MTKHGYEEDISYEKLRPELLQSDTLNKLPAHAYESSYFFYESGSTRMSHVPVDDVMYMSAYGYLSIAEAFDMFLSIKISQ